MMIDLMSRSPECSGWAGRTCHKGDTATSEISATNWPSLIALAMPTSFGRGGWPSEAAASPSVVNAPTTCGAGEMSLHITRYIKRLATPRADAHRVAVL